MGMTMQDQDNLRTMRHMRDRSPVENAAYALGALSHADKLLAVTMFNKIWGDTSRPQYTTINIKFTGYDK
jgi:hypothetical protein